MPRPVHFEIHASDLKAVAEFYGALFGWTFNQFGEFPYMLADTGEGDGIDGAIMARQGPAPEVGAPVMGATIVIGVEDIDAEIARALQLGATEAAAKMAVPGVGWAAYLHDPDGNVFGLFQDDTEAR